DQLRRIETQLDGTPVESVVRFGEPAEEILLEAEAFDADLVALATSVRSRLRSALLPGVAERVARKAPVPTLLLRVSRPRGRRRPASRARGLARPGRRTPDRWTSRSPPADPPAPDGGSTHLPSRRAARDATVAPARSRTPARPSPTRSRPLNQARIRPRARAA